MFNPVDAQLNFAEQEEQILKLWDEKSIFDKSLKNRDGADEYVFYEGPPTANGKPGVHHVQARSYKDVFPRFKSMQGYYVARKAGWDCHGLPVELEIEKKLGFDGKKDIENYGVGPFNKACRASVMEYEGVWEQLTKRIGFWVDLKNAYMTMSNDFVESVWWSLKQLWDKGLLYQGYKVVPYCGHDGTPLSSHEVSQGYQEITDISAFARFPLREPKRLGWEEEVDLLVWTTTPWTLTANSGVGIHQDIAYGIYVHPEHRPILLAQSLAEKLVPEEESWSLARALAGTDLIGLEYQAPYHFIKVEDPMNIHTIAHGDFVTDSDGTGLVHIAPAFGADDNLLGKTAGFPVLRTVDEHGRFLPEVTLVAGAWFKDADIPIIKDLAHRDLLFKKQKYKHSYPHCWRCKNPLMYYATDSWFIANTKYKERLIELNQTIDWHPDHIKNGRYGDWLNNLVDWALSRNRYWGTPLPIWSCDGCEHRVCIGSYAELAEFSNEPIDQENFDPHRPFIDDVQGTCPHCSGTLTRVEEVIDCWYDSGAMPFAQLHYPFENKDLFEKRFPADFICEGLDQTRGWFNSLHQLGTMLFDSIAYRSVICHGLVLDGNGEKMSKSKGNTVDPWTVINSVGADALRWYLYSSAPPELSRRFSEELVQEAFRRYLLTLWNSYNFFILNANASKSKLSLSDDFELGNLSKLDRWILGRLQETIRTVTQALESYDVTNASRSLEAFVEELSNWYVRRSRRQFWDENEASFKTLFHCLVTVAKLSAPFIPFLSESIYQNLKRALPDGSPESVHLCDWPVADSRFDDPVLLEEMDTVLKLVSVGRAARNQSGHRVRQPLASVVVACPMSVKLTDEASVRSELQEELNVKEVTILEPGSSFVEYRVKPNLPVIGKKWGRYIPAIKAFLAEQEGRDIVAQLDSATPLTLNVGQEVLELSQEDLLIEPTAPEGFVACEEHGYLVAISCELTPELIHEGWMRDLIRHIQDLRKEAQLDIADRIHLSLKYSDPEVEIALEPFLKTIELETLATEIKDTKLTDPTTKKVVLDDHEVQVELQVIQ